MATTKFPPSLAESTTKEPGNTANPSKARSSKPENPSKQKLTYHWHEIAPWQRDNIYITSGYRAQSNSYLKSFSSLSYLHNESVNIYTHLLGALIFLCASYLLYGELKPRYDTASREDVYVFGCFFAGAVACLGMSGTYHTIGNHSHEVAVWGNKLDYLGIVGLIWGSFVPVIWYAFESETALMRGYWSMITTLAAGTSLACVHPQFRTPALRPVRALMFVLMGLSAVFPVLHGIKLYGIEHLQRSIGLNWIVLQGALYIAGAGLYAARVPERLAPGKFDIWGSSHQIFHVLVLLAAASHLVGLVKAFDYHHSSRAVLDKVLGL